MTWSILARDAATGAFGVAVTTKFFAVGAGCPHAMSNAGARSRRCHHVKQSPGWTVTQPKPGWHQWTTPTGRTYTQEPWRYTA